MSSGLGPKADLGRMEDEGRKANLNIPLKDECVETINVVDTCDNEFEMFCLKRELLRGIVEKGWKKPSPIQEASIPIALSGKNILAFARKGTGNSGAYLISVLQQIDSHKNVIQALVVVPSQAPAMQTFRICNELAMHMDVKIMVITGGTNLHKDIETMNQGVQVVITWPERFFHLPRKVTDMSQCRIVVLDELGAVPPKCFNAMVKRIIPKSPEERQIWLFSATLSPTVEKFVTKHLKDPYVIDFMEGSTKYKLISEVTDACGIEFDKFCLKRELLMGIDYIGWEKSSRLQEASIPIALSGKDILAFAEKGGGKSGAYLIPVLQQIDSQKNVIQALVLVPTRDFSEQISKICIDLARDMDVKVLLTSGGTSLRPDIEKINQGVQVIIATPGRIIDLMINKNVADMNQCRILVLDGAEKLLSQDFKGMLDHVISRLPRERQTLLYSSTFTPVVKQFKDKHMRNPYEINLMDESTIQKTQPKKGKRL